MQFNIICVCNAVVWPTPPPDQYGVVRCPRCKRDLTQSANDNAGAT